MDRSGGWIDQVGGVDVCIPWLSSWGPWEWSSSPVCCASKQIHISSSSLMLSHTSGCPSYPYTQACLPTYLFISTNFLPILEGIKELHRFFKAPREVIHGDIFLDFIHQSIVFFLLGGKGKAHGGGSVTDIVASWWWWWWDCSIKWGRTYPCNIFTDNEVQQDTEEEGMNQDLYTEAAKEREAWEERRYDDDGEV